MNQIEGLSEMTENMVADLISQLLKAVQYLHSKNIVYRGLKLDVLLLETADKIQDSRDLKLIDIDIQAALSAANEPLLGAPLCF